MAAPDGTVTEALLPSDAELGELDPADVKLDWLSETKVLIGLSAPAIVQLAAQQGLVVTNQVMLGRCIRHAVLVCGDNCHECSVCSAGGTCFSKDHADSEPTELLAICHDAP